MHNQYKLHLISIGKCETTGFAEDCSARSCVVRKSGGRRAFASHTDRISVSQAGQPALRRHINGEHLSLDTWTKCTVNYLHVIVCLRARAEHTLSDKRYPLRSFVRRRSKVLFVWLCLKPPRDRTLILLRSPSYQTDTHMLQCC